MILSNVLCIVFDLISALKSSSFKEKMIISLSFRGNHVLVYIERLIGKIV